ncbi:MULTISPECIES: fructosamine kinase family protein [Tatumella]|uniref:Fructosamine kinase family protein n=1 Tax=Tatumella punctata TaxID=399969 RepID=A0ABW1VUC7_9GAMM|nr:MULTISPECIES: fructosamine kinase family protein [unclassified Tatumella]MBS0855009.1 fructosamine kinase family protein [Tatumella sp. JGM16]MBS0876040.1 fructosamine kinase family protein [Tatumella sp. JGM82]MBS0890514.1 fructosamine kinase family protein [Tatumella sp. JGM94]MBS0900970.1 fructosamine kinase family protein [Tatumella sp. JGM100]MBS0911904.1 fructosamine kinase family protein [Tatumella sp. JGM91]
MWSAITRLLEEQQPDLEGISYYHQCHGGEVNQSWQLICGDKHFFIKSNHRAMLPRFIEEADQLALLARTGCVKVPRVYGTGTSRHHSFLILEYLPPAPLSADTASVLGRQLAQLHQWNEQPKFGLDFDNSVTLSPQPNNWQHRWSLFFSEQRIGWQLQIAAEKQLSFGNTEQIIQCINRCLEHHHPSPSLLHGDLWPGHCAESHDSPWLFNPACYWGDRECDLALWQPDNLLSSALLDSYQAVSPLPAGYRERQPAYRLYYLLNRACAFGGHWQAEAQQTINQLVRKYG